MHRKLAVAAFLLALGVPAFAQRTTGDVIGTVKDESGAMLPGVSVSISGPNIVGTKTDVTSGNGVYRIGGLPPGTYSVAYTLAGFKTLNLREVRVNVGGTVEENVALGVSQLAEQIEVVAESAVVDTTSTEVGTTFDNDWVKAAPTRRSGFYDLVAHAPGSVRGSDDSRRTMVFGGSFDENSFQLDGVNVTDNYFNEGFAEPNPDSIEEVEVLSLGAPAEYGNLMGAVYNIVTKQGTNAYHGDASYFYQSDGLSGNNTENVKLPNDKFFDACADDPTKRCPWTRGTYWEVSAQLGGPIVKDKLWFFGSYGRARDNYTGPGVNSQGRPLSAINIEKEVFFLKLNWQISPSHRLVGNFNRDKSPQDLGLSFNETPSTAWTRTRTVPTVGLSYTGTLSSSTTLDVRYSGFYGNQNGYPTDPDAPLSEPRFVDFDSGLITGGHYYWYDYDPKRTTVTAKVSHHADDFLGGDHDFRFGVQYNDAGVKGIYGYNDLVFTYAYEGTQYSYGYERQPFTYAGTARNIGAFFDDSFRVNDRLTLNLGLRYDHSKAFSPANEGFDENGKPTGETFPRVDHFTWTNFSPRLGLNWKLSADGKTVLKVHGGRYHPQITTGEFTNVLGPSIKPYYLGYGYNLATGTFDDLSLFASADNLSVDPNYRSPRTDQFLVGFERELFRNVGLQLAYVRKWGRDFPGWDETEGTYQQIPIVDDTGKDPTGSTINVFKLTSDPGARLFRITNTDKVYTDVQAVSATLTKRMTNWYANATATWLRSEGLVGGSAFGSSIQQRSALEFNPFGRNPNDYVNAAGRLNGDIGWQFKLQFVWQMPAGFIFSTSADYREGGHRLRLRSLPSSVTGVSSLVTMSPRGSFGRLPSFTIIDARLQKDFKLGGSKRLSVFVDALNLNNEDANQAVQSARVTSSVYQYPSTFAQPRRFMLGAKASF